MELSQSYTSPRGSGEKEGPIAQQGEDEGPVQHEARSRGPDNSAKSPSPSRAWGAGPSLSPLARGEV